MSKLPCSSPEQVDVFSKHLGLQPSKSKMPPPSQHSPDDFSVFSYESEFANSQKQNLVTALFQIHVLQSLKLSTMKFLELIEKAREASRIRITIINLITRLLRCFHTRSLRCRHYCLCKIQFQAISLNSCFSSFFVMEAYNFHLQFFLLLQVSSLSYLFDEFHFEFSLFLCLMYLNPLALYLLFYTYNLYFMASLPLSQFQTMLLVRTLNLHPSLTASCGYLAEMFLFYNVYFRSHCPQSSQTNVH